MTFYLIPASAFIYLSLKVFLHWRIFCSYILYLTSTDFSNSRQTVILSFLWKIRKNSLPTRIFLGGKCSWQQFKPCLSLPVSLEVFLKFLLQFYFLNLTCDFSNSRQIVTLRFLWKIRKNSLPSRIFLGGKMQLATDVCNWDNGFSSDVAKLRRLDSTGCTLIQNHENWSKYLSELKLTCRN